MSVTELSVHTDNKILNSMNVDGVFYTFLLNNSSINRDRAENLTLTLHNH